MKVPARSVQPHASLLGDDVEACYPLAGGLGSRASGRGIAGVRSPSLVLGVVAVAVCLASARIGGPPGVMAGLGILVGTLTSVRHYARSRAERIAEAALPEVALRIARELQIGGSLEGALIALETQPAERTKGIELLIRQLRAGRPIEPALGTWLTTAASGAERLLAASMILGVSHGGPLGSAIDGVGEGLRDELQHSARRRLLLVQATMSTAVLVSLPVVFAIVVSIVRGASVLHGAAGVLLITGGVLLDALGLWWMSVLMRRLR